MKSFKFFPFFLNKFQFVCFQLPMVLSTLQRSIYAVALGKPTKPNFFTNGVPKNSLIEEVKHYQIGKTRKLNP